MKYLIFATDNQRFRTKTSWVNNPSELFEGEKMMSFNSRKEADEVISKGFKNCASYAITKNNPFFKYC